MQSSFYEWCKSNHSKDEKKNTVVGEWLELVLKDKNFPWNGTCQDIYEYFQHDTDKIEAFLCAWEESGRTVEIDEDYSSDTFDEEEESSETALF